MLLIIKTNDDKIMKTVIYLSFISHWKIFSEGRKTEMDNGFKNNYYVSVYEIYKLLIT